MTIAVAVRKGREIVVAADTQNNFGSARATPDNHLSHKIMPVGDALVATSGWGLYANILDDFVARGRRAPALGTEREVFRFFQQFWRALKDQYSLVNEQCHDDDHSPFGDLDASFLVVNPAGIFFVSSDTSVTPFEKYHAVGSGTDYALGALHALYDDHDDATFLARRACEAAIAFNIYCGGAIETARLPL
jgi:ATP-dependent HslUV protease, peptidase subunit HslV